MAQTAPTPGPWEVRNGCNVVAPNAHVPLTNLNTIAVTGGLSGVDTIERDAANARLIAASPDLLAALKLQLDYEAALSVSDDRRRATWMELVKVRDAAIAKATGAA